MIQEFIAKKIKYHLLTKTILVNLPLCCVLISQAFSNCSVLSDKVKLRIILINEMKMLLRDSTLILKIVSKLSVAGQTYCQVAYFTGTSEWNLIFKDSTVSSCFVEVSQD